MGNCKSYDGIYCHFPKIIGDPDINAVKQRNCIFNGNAEVCLNDMKFGDAYSIDTFELIEEEAALDAH